MEQALNLYNQCEEIYKSQNSRGFLGNKVIAFTEDYSKTCRILEIPVKELYKEFTETYTIDYSYFIKVLESKWQVCKKGKFIFVNVLEEKP